MKGKVNFDTGEKVYKHRNPSRRRYAVNLARIVCIFFVFFLVLIMKTLSVNAQEMDMLELDTLFSTIDLSGIRSQDIDSVLPVFIAEDTTSLLRSGTEEFFRRLEITDRDTVKKCIMIGASWAKVNWDWQYFLRGKSSYESLKYPTEQNLTTVSHFLEDLGADPVLLHRVKNLRNYYDASNDSMPPISEVTLLKEDIGKEIELFFSKNSNERVSYFFGKWLVWLSEFSFLSLHLEDKKQIMLVGKKMIEFHLRISTDKFWDVIDGLPLPDEGYLARIRKAVMKLRELSDLDDIDEFLERIRDLKERIDNVFDRLKIWFF